MLQIEQTVVVVVDVQGKLAQLVAGREALFRNLQILIQGAQVLGLPVLWCEQNPAGLGPTVPEIATLLAGQKPIAKMNFSCWGAEPFREALRATGRRQVLLAGIEAHVCVYLTAVDLVEAGWQVEVVADAVSSRSDVNKQLALARLQNLGGGITCTETALFELLRVAEGPRFKQILHLLK